MLMFKDRLKKLRKEKELTQKEIAKELDITQQQYAKWENGERNPNSETLEKLADYFKVTTDYLLGRTNYNHYIFQTEDVSELFANKIYGMFTVQIIKQNFEELLPEISEAVSYGSLEEYPIPKRIEYLQNLKLEINSGLKLKEKQNYFERELNEIINSLKELETNIK